MIDGISKNQAVKGVRKRREKGGWRI